MVMEIVGGREKKLLLSKSNVASKKRELRFVKRYDRHAFGEFPGVVRMIGVNTGQVRYGDIRRSSASPRPP